MQGLSKANVKRYSDVILLSGGVDSTYLAATVKPVRPPGLALFVDYGQPSAKKENAAAATLAKACLLDFRTVQVRGLPLGKMDEWSSGPAVVPARNLWMIALAAAFGETIWIGAAPQDWADYADCRRPFLDSLDRSLRLLGSTLRYSLVEREARVTHLRDVGFEAYTWSCYGPGPKPCGQCASCSQ